MTFVPKTIAAVARRFGLAERAAVALEMRAAMPAESGDVKGELASLGPAARAVLAATRVWLEHAERAGTISSAEARTLRAVRTAPEARALAELVNVATKAGSGRA